MKHILWKNALRSVAVLLAGLSCTQAQHTNFVVILLDDAGWRDIGFAGNSYIETPHLDQLAGQGTQFNTAYATHAFCTPSRQSMMTGQWPARTAWMQRDEVTNPDTPRGAPEYSPAGTASWTLRRPEFTSIAEALGAAGYATAHIGKWHFGLHDYDISPESEGFDLNFGGDNSVGAVQNHFAPYEGLPGSVSAPPGEYLTDRLTQETIDFITAHTNQPFYVQLWHYAPHTPIQAPEDVVNYYRARRDQLGDMNLNPTYAAMIDVVDQGVGQIVQTLETLGLDDNTVILFTSDNGGVESLGGIPVTSMEPMRGQKGWTYEGGVREPMFITGPGVAAGATADEPVSILDFYPTILEMAGVPLPAQTIDGVSLVPLLTTGSQPALSERPLFWYNVTSGYDPHGDFFQPVAAVRRGDWRLVKNFERPPELYYLPGDPGEAVNLAGSWPAKTAELEGLLDNWLADTGIITPLANPFYDPDYVIPHQIDSVPAGFEVSRHWKLDSAACGWSEVGQVSTSFENGAMRLLATDDYPQVKTTDVSGLPAGKYVAQIELAAPTCGRVRLAWIADGDSGGFDLLPQYDGEVHTLTAVFESSGPLQELRIAAPTHLGTTGLYDPSEQPGWIDVHSVTLLNEAASGDRLQAFVRSGTVQTETLSSLALDDFNRADTAVQTNSGPSAIGVQSNDWNVAAQGWLVENDALAMERIVIGVPGLLLWQPELTVAANGAGFDVQADITINATASSAWAGVAFHAFDINNYYTLRYSGAGLIHLLRIAGGSTTILDSSSFAHTSGHPYRLRVTCSEPGVFFWRIADGLSGAVLDEGVAEDAQAAALSGYGGIYSSTPVAGADNFRLQVSEALDSPKQINGTPALAAGGRIVVPDAFNAPADSNPETAAEFQKAAENGLDIMFLRRVCESVDAGDGTYTFNTNLLDQGISDVLTVNPDARILLNIGGLHPPWSWYSYYSHEPKLLDADGERSVFPDPSSPIYRGVSKQYISNVVSYIEAQPYADSVEGYHISVFEGGEWMMPDGYWGYSDSMQAAFRGWLEARYGTVAALEAAWSTNGIGSFSAVDVPPPSAFAAADRGPFRDPVLRRPVIDFTEFWQFICSDCLLDFCRTAKEASGREVEPLVGAFYGYILETGQVFYKGHHNLQAVLNSPWIDFLAAPYSYVYRSPAWLGVDNADIGAGMFHGPVDSILANGKLFYTEDDSRTYLTADDVKTHFTNLTDTVNNLRRNQLTSLTRGAGIWRLDLYGDGWYNSDGIMQELGLQKRLNEAVVRDASYAQAYAPEVALIFDEQSSFNVATLSETDPRQRVSISMFLRDHLARAGVSYGVYLLSDLVNGRVPDCSTYLFAGTYEMNRTERSWIDENLKRNGKTLIWLYGSGLYDETGWGLDRMSALTGFDIAEAPDLAPTGIKPSTELIAAMNDTIWNNPGIAGHPEWFVDNVSSNATVLASYVHGSTYRPAIVREEKGGWTSVYIGALRLEARWLLGLVRLCGLHQVLDTDETVPVTAGRGIIGIWPATSLTGTVQLQQSSDVYDFYSGALLHSSVTGFSVSLPQWQTAAYKIQPVGRPWQEAPLLNWQTTHFSTAEISAGLADAGADADGDGDSNEAEYIAGSDPRDPASRFKMSVGPGLRLSFNTASERTYTLYAKTNLMQPLWEPFITVPGTATGAVMNIDAVLPAEYFRLDAELD